MIELPEASVLSDQIGETLIGKRVRAVTVLATPHKFAWFHGDPQEYPSRLRDKRVTGAEPLGGMVRLRLGRASLVFQEGPVLRYTTEGAALPKKHQLLVEFGDSSFLSVSIRMYGGIACFEGQAREGLAHVKELTIPVVAPVICFRKRRVSGKFTG